MYKKAKQKIYKRKGKRKLYKRGKRKIGMFRNIMHKS